MSSKDFREVGCDVALTNPDQMSANTIANISLGLLQMARNAFQSMWPSLMSLILECPSWKWYFFGVPWYLNTTSLGAIFFVSEDDEDFIISAQKRKKLVQRAKNLTQNKTLADKNLAQILQNSEKPIQSSP